MAIKRKTVTKAGKAMIFISDEALDEYYAQNLIWIERMMQMSNSVLNYFYSERRGFCDIDIETFLQISDENEDEVTVASVRASLHKRTSLFATKIDRSGAVFRNIGMLAQHFPLDKVQQELLAFSTMIDSCEALKECVNNLNPTSNTTFFRMLDRIFDLPALSISKALASEAPLRSSGLLKIVRDCHYGITLEPMNGLSDALTADNRDADDMLSHFVQVAKPSSLHDEDFSHISGDYALLTTMLDTAMKCKDVGVNVLIYGVPGSGKSELSRLLSARLGGKLFEVKNADDDGDPVAASRRLEWYRFCQQFLSTGERNMILFDEVEDVFPARSFSFFGMETRSGNNKGWINKALEENHTPAIWICNTIRQIDPAFLRRFDYALELNTPPKKVRMRILQSRLEGMQVSEPFISRLAEHEQLSPAQVANASTVVRRLHCTSTQQAEDALLKVLGNSAKSMGQKPLRIQRSMATAYSLDYLNCDMDIPKLIQGLGRNSRGNICFYGAPGTGKTALAKHIATVLDKPLLSKKASDLLSKWVGESEHNIANMFAQAIDEEAVLILDEADSLLRDRRGASRSWEVTQVNELLVQMENFDGIFICSTNLMDDLDPASLRRFAIKVEFSYLKQDQAWSMFCAACSEEPLAVTKRALSRLESLAPGDFAAVNKRLDILGEPATPERLLDYLSEECKIKQGNRPSSIGFTR